MAEQLHGRVIALSVDTIKVSPRLRIKGKATKTYKPEPNTLEVSVYNLTAEQRTQLSNAKTPIVKLAAGYDSTRLTQLFYGEALHVRHEMVGADIITTIATTDGGEKKQKARVNVSFGRNTKTGTVLTRILQALGLPGNGDEIARELDRSAQSDMYLEGACVSGSAADELSHLLRSCGYDWSIQDGVVVIRKLGTPADGFAIELNPSSGLIGSPAISNKGVCSGTCLIVQPEAGLDLQPGRLVHVSSEFVKGQFILAKTDFEFDSYADPWFCQFEAVTKKGDLALI